MRNAAAHGGKENPNMAQDDEPTSKPQPLPGHETQSEEMACPKCGRFVGAATKCPYCGAKVEKRMSLVAIRWAAVLLSTVGLFLLYLMARSREPERIRIGDIETTMNFGVVRLSGEVRNDPRPFKNGNGMSFNVSDGSGSIIVFVDQAQRKAMADAGLLPRKGDGIDFVAQLQASSSGSSARIRSLNPSSFQLTRDDGTPVARASAADGGEKAGAPDRSASAPSAKDFGPAVAFSAVDASLVGQSVVLEGTVVAIKEPAADTKQPYVVTLTNGVEGADLKVWPDQFLQIPDAQSLTGTAVRVRAAVKLWKDKVDLQLKKGSDLQRAVPAAPKRRAPVPVATAAAEMLGNWVTVVGALSEPADLDGKGTSYKLTDDSGSIQVVFWNSTVPPDLQRRAAAAARASVNGKVKEYQGTRQVVPSKATGVEIVE
jgi:RPA family protein